MKPQSLRCDVVWQVLNTPYINTDPYCQIIPNCDNKGCTVSTVWYWYRQIISDNWYLFSLKFLAIFTFYVLAALQISYISHNISRMSDACIIQVSFILETNIFLVLHLLVTQTDCHKQRNRFNLAQIECKYSGIIKNQEILANWVSVKINSVHPQEQFWQHST